jgi:methylisocitrate lyase
MIMAWMIDGITANDPVSDLKALLKSGEAVPVPGVTDPLTSIIADRMGFKCLYFSGAAFSASLGIPDIGLFSIDQLIDSVKWITRSTNLPLIVDIDTGFGDVVNVIRVIKELEYLGVAAVQLEDQVSPKRCGHLDGKQIVSEQQFVEKLGAALEARENMLVIARTDSRDVYSFDESVKRGILYRNSGADVIFPEALENIDEFKQYAMRINTPLLANMTEFGKSPLLSVKELGDIGYNLVIFPATGQRAALGAVKRVFTDIKETGSQIGSISGMMDRSEIYNLIDYDDFIKLDSKIAPKITKKNAF